MRIAGKEPFLALGSDGRLGCLGWSTSGVDFAWDPSGAADPSALDLAGSVTGTVSKLEYCLGAG